MSKLTDKINKAHNEFKREYEKSLHGVDRNDPDAVSLALIRSLAQEDSDLAGKLGNWYEVIE